MFASLLLPLLHYTLLLSKALQPAQILQENLYEPKKKVGKLLSKSKDRAEASMFLAALKEENMYPIMLHKHRKDLGKITDRCRL